MSNGYNLCSSIRKYFRGTILKTTDIYIYISLHRAILYLRFIDDIFMIWTENMQELLIFLENLNSKHKTIKFEHNVSRSRISFLDTEYSIVYWFIFNVGIYIYIYISISISLYIIFSKSERSYETCDCTRTPLHTPKTLDTC